MKISASNAKQLEQIIKINKKILSIFAMLYIISFWKFVCSTIFIIKLFYCLPSLRWTEEDFSTRTEISFMIKSNLNNAYIAADITGSLASSLNRVCEIRESGRPARRCKSWFRNCSVRGGMRKSVVVAARGEKVKILHCVRHGTVFTRKGIDRLQNSQTM